MTLQFENDLEYQNEAISSICDIFEGEETFQNIFSMTEAKIGRASCRERV